MPYAALKFRRVELAHLIEDFAIICQRLVSNGQHFRDIDRAARLRRKFNAEARGVCLRIGSQVDKLVIHSSADTSNKFCFAEWRALVVQAAKSAFPVVEGRITLHKAGLEAVISKLFRAEGTSKEAARIVLLVQLDNECAFEICFGEFHERFASLVSGCSKVVFVQTPIPMRRISCYCIKGNITREP